MERLKERKASGTRKIQRKKGFTLVEIIVVLVIIAILAAAGIPAMLNVIGDARAKAYIAEARFGYTVVQAVYTEQYMTRGSAAVATIGNRFSDSTTVSKLNNMLSPDLTESELQYLFSTTSGAIQALVYRPTGTDTYVKLVPGQAAEVSTKDPLTVN